MCRSAESGRITIGDNNVLMVLRAADPVSPSGNCFQSHVGGEIVVEDD